MALAPAPLRCTTADPHTNGLWPSSTASSCWWAALPCIPAAPILLWRTPPCHPVGKTSIAIVGRAGDADWSATSTLPWAAFSMNSATPLLLAHGPSHDPIGEAIGTIVWVGRAGWHDRCRWQHRHWHRHRQWLRAALVVHPAAPCPLVCCPTVRCVNCAIEGVDWTNGPRRRQGARRQRAWRGARRRWRRRGWGCWRRGWRRSWLRSGRSHAGGHASHPCCATAILLLRQRPGCLPAHRTSAAIISRRTREQVQQQGQQQQQAEKAARRDDASEVPSRANCVEVAATSDIPVRCFLNICTMACAHV